MENLRGAVLAWEKCRVTAEGKFTLLLTLKPFQSEKPFGINQVIVPLAVLIRGQCHWKYTWISHSSVLQIICVPSQMLMLHFLLVALKTSCQL